MAMARPGGPAIPASEPALPPAPVRSVGFHGAVLEFKRRLIEATLSQLGGNRTRTARALGLQRTYLLRLMREFGVDIPHGAGPYAGGAHSRAREVRAPSNGGSNGNGRRNGGGGSHGHGSYLDVRGPREDGRSVERPAPRPPSDPPRAPGARRSGSVGVDTWTGRGLK